MFRSSKSGIVAAKEAKDGSGVLAVADSHVVVLHDTKRGQEKSWGLRGDDDQVRLLEYTPDAKALFLTTRLTGAIQRYSPERACLVDPAQAHSSPPAALTVSPTAHLLLSASEDPPVVCLKNLAQNTAPHLIEPRASDAPVSVAAFHPERPNIFLLAFKDGTLAAYDATRIIRRSGAGQTVNDGSDNGGEISHFGGLHRTTNRVGKDTNAESQTTAAGSKSAGITGAAFLPGYKLRAISVGGDGRCRLLDFADGGTLLRTWHAKAPLTSVSVLAVKEWRRPTPAGQQKQSSSGVRKGPANKSTMGGPTITNNIIAVSRADGKAHIYDSVGILLEQRTVSGTGERVISVDWVKGSAPRGLPGSHVVVQDVSDAPSVPLREQPPTVLSPKEQIPRKNTFPRNSATPKRLGLPASLKKPDLVPESSSMVPRKFSIHPDEEDGTVRRTPSPVRAGPSMQPPVAGDYHDLFSPVKSPNTQGPNASDQHILGSPRTLSRPRISSRTFVKDATPRRVPTVTSAATRNPALFPSVESTASTGSETEKPTPHHKVETKPIRRINTAKPTPYGSVSKRISFKQINSSYSSLDGADSAHNTNRKILADLRKMSEAGPVKRKPSTLSVFAPYLHRAKSVIKHEPKEREANWPEDSVSAATSEGIWLTSDEDNGTRQRQKRRRAKQLKRPPARQTSRSRAESGSTVLPASHFSDSSMSPDVQRTHHPFHPGTTGMTQRASFEDEAMLTAHSRLSLEATFSPSSASVRQLVPRRSSLSPHKDAIPPGAHLEPSQNFYRGLALNAALGRQQRSPWAKARDGRRGKQAARKQSIQFYEDPAATADPASQQAGRAGEKCVTCTTTVAKVRSLEADVARLKGEVLVMKAAMRRNGVAL